MSPTSFHKRNLAQQVAEQLSQMINQNQWFSGRRLPAVRDLADQFGVSANTAHAALRLLADKGVVGLRPRQGAFVEGRKRATTPTAVTKNQIGVIWPASPGDLPSDASASERDNWRHRIVHTADKAFHDAGFYVTSLGYLGGDGIATALPRVRQMFDRLAGVLCFAGPNINLLTEELDRADIPWVTINATDRRSTHNFVTADNLDDCCRVGQILAGMGVRRVLALSTPIPLNMSGSDKILGVFQGFIDSGVSTTGIEVVNCADWTESSGYEASRRFLSSGNPPPQAVFTTGDMLAMGAIRACRERGLRVPEDVGVIGTTGLQVAAFSQPSLTVVAQPMEEMGRSAAQMLTEMAREGVRRMVGRRISGKFILRDSLQVPATVREESSLTTGGIS